MEINNNKLNSLPQQVEENMKNIKLLASYLKEAYSTSLTLNNTDVSIAISDTNASSDTIEGWLIDSIANLFKITSGDGTNLLIEYYTSLRGEQGVQGIPGDPTELIDDNSIELNKTWSSDKINTEIANAGKTYYQHNILLDGMADSKVTRLFITIINTDSTPFTQASLKSWLYENGFVQDGSNIHGYQCTGIQGSWIASSIRCQYYNGSYTLFIYTNDYWERQISTINSVEDYVKQLG